MSDRTQWRAAVAVVCIGGFAVFGIGYVMGDASAFTAAVRGQVNNAVANRTGVLGVSTGAAATYGVTGANDAQGTNSAGVLGYSSSRAGSNASYFGAGVRGEGGLDGFGMGVLGISSRIAVVGDYISPNGGTSTEGLLGYGSAYGVFANGNSGATGIKTFVDPHPDDAALVVRYVALEGPEPGTYFRGRSRFVDGRAVIEVPESFRLTTEAEGLTVTITPMGRVADAGAVSVVSASLDEIVAEATRDGEFSYHVFGVRKGYAGYRAIAPGYEFVPRSAEQRLPGYLTPLQQHRLIRNGTYNPNGTVNTLTAARLGWDRAWPPSQGPRMYK